MSLLPQQSTPSHADTFTAIVPSNIAFIKYWGKRDEKAQWPTNNSLSMTLSNARTETKAALISGSEHEIWVAKTPGGPLERVYDGKAKRHLDFLSQELNSKQCLRIESRNTFPTGAGIASSASGLGALTLAAISALTNQASFDGLETAGFPRQRLAALARLGSGSATRSFFPGFVAWDAGDEPNRQVVSQVVSPEDWLLADLIVVVAKEEKTISSTEGHRSAWTSPLFLPRLAGLKERFQHVEDSLKNRDLTRLGEAIEAEALEMHAVMMTSTPPIHYLTKESFAFITWLRQMRSKGLPAYFTIDAGPNIHVITELKHSDLVKTAIFEAFPHSEIIVDHVGHGPTITRERL